MMKTMFVFLFVFLLSAAAPGSAQTDEEGDAPGEIHTGEHIAKSSLQDLSRQANNPVSTLWTLQNQFDLNTVDDIPKGGGGTSDDRVSFKWIFGAFPQQWFSFAGDRDREDVSLLDVQYFVWRLFPGAWQVGFAQDITANWKADGGNTWTVPVGLGAGKTFELGGHHFKIDAQVSYAVVHPDDAGQRWGFRIRFSPIIGALCCTGTLLE